MDSSSLTIESLRRQLREEQRARQQAEHRTRKTTLFEYLKCCHAHLFKTITVETDRSLSTQGEITNPSGKSRPVRLRPWENFLEVQKETFERLFALYPHDEPPRVFENLAFIEGLSDRVASRKLASEGDLQNLQRETIETPVTSIIRHLTSLDNIRALSQSWHQKPSFQSRVALQGHKPPQAALNCPQLGRRSIRDTSNCLWTC